MFKPGDRLVEADLCVRLGVSRPSVREALRSLEAEGLVNIVPNRGPQIPVLTWEQAEEIYQVRALLEGEAAALCAKRATREHIDGTAMALEAWTATRPEWVKDKKVIHLAQTGPKRDPQFLGVPTLI